MTSETVPSSEILNVVVTVVVAPWAMAVKATLVLPLAPGASVAATELVQTVPATDPSAQLQLPLDPAVLNVALTGTVVLTTSAVLVMVAAVVFS